MSISAIAQTSNSGITNAREYIDNSANTLLRVKSASGISGFLFDVKKEESIDLTADVTDHYTENGSYLNDHKVLKPLEITLSGYIGELVYEGGTGVSGALETLSNKLTTVESYLGDYTPGMLQLANNAITKAQSVVSNINQQLDRLQNIVSALSGDSAEDSKQKQAFTSLSALWAGSSLLTVQTPWAYFDNMVITAVSFAQGEDSDSYSDISVSLKQLRIAETQTTDYDETIFPVNTEIQSGDTEAQGTIRGTDNESASLLYTAALGG